MLRAPTPDLIDLNTPAGPSARSRSPYFAGSDLIATTRPPSPLPGSGDGGQGIATTRAGGDGLPGHALPGSPRFDQALALARERVAAWMRESGEVPDTLVSRVMEVIGAFREMSSGIPADAGALLRSAEHAVRRRFPDRPPAATDGHAGSAAQGSAGRAAPAAPGGADADDPLASLYSTCREIRDVYRPGAGAMAPAGGASRPGPRSSDAIAVRQALLRQLEETIAGAPVPPAAQQPRMASRPQSPIDAYLSHTEDLFFFGRAQASSGLQPPAPSARPALSSADARALESISDFVEAYERASRQGSVPASAGGRGSHAFLRPPSGGPGAASSPSARSRLSSRSASFSAPPGQSGSSSELCFTGRGAATGARRSTVSSAGGGVWIPAATGQPGPAAAEDAPRQERAAARPGLRRWRSHDDLRGAFRQQASADPRSFEERLRERGYQGDPQQIAAALARAGSGDRGVD